MTQDKPTSKSFSLERLWLKAIHAENSSLLGLLRLVTLWPMSLVYRLGFAISKSLAPKPLNLSVSLITVGGVTVGGAGKTPFVALVARELQKSGKKVGIVCSGYGRANNIELVENGSALLLRPVADTGDEPRELAEMFPDMCFAISKSKRNAVKTLSDKGAVDVAVDVIVVDDGFQTRGLKPDLAITLIDSNSTVADFRLLPFGRLREPLTALKRSDIVVFTKLDSPASEPAGWIQDAVSAAYDGIVLKSAMETKLVQALPALSPGDTLTDASSRLTEPAILVSGLADNAGFRKTAQALEIQCLGMIEFPDHFDYDANSVAAILSEIEAVAAKAIVTTGKDWVKLREFSWNVPVWIIKVRSELDQKERFATLLKEATQIANSDSV